MRVVYFLLLYVHYVACYEDNVDSEVEEYRRIILDKLTKTRTQLLDNFHLVTRQVATEVSMFRSYRDVNVIFYPIIRDVTEARFTFQSEELHMNNIGSCSPRDVIINIKRGSYPAVNPDGYPFPKGFIDPDTREEIHTIELKSDGTNVVYTIKNPKPGSWYALVYIKWEDPRIQRVAQEGLVASCDTILYSDLQVKREEDLILVDCYAGFSVDASSLPTIYKCISVDSPNPIRLEITVTNGTLSSDLLFKVQALALPSDTDNLITCAFAFDPNINDVQTITFSPHPNSWHYIQIEKLEGNASSYAHCESYYLKTDTEEENDITMLDLMRDDKGRFFTFDYGLPTTDVKDATSLVNLSSSDISTFRFKVNQFIDIGGSLLIEASLVMSLKYYMGYKRELKKGSVLAFTEENQFFKTVICMDVGHASIPLHTGHCKYNDKVRPALFVLNSTDSDSVYDKTIIPFPDTGTYYLTFGLFCDGVVCPCPTSHNGTKYYVDVDGLDQDGADVSGELSNHTRQGERHCNASLILSISSTSCVNGQCSNHGRCALNTFGGLVMSYCSCTAGYGGWDCSDDSRMDSRLYMLMAVLFLTMSNLVFMLSIYVAIIRLYYTEAMMYAFTMVFSTFYHACDAPAQVSYCITRGNILQFGDFYCGLMCFWVTLLAMSIMSDKFRSSLQLIGAIVIALLTTWNMHSFVAFVLPVAIGGGILLLSWYWDYRKNRKFIYPRTYYTRYFPLGLALVSVGLICFAFLQTERNYKIVHSVWHMIIASSVVFLLPDVRREGKHNPFVPSPNTCNFKFSKIFQSKKRAQAPLTSENGENPLNGPTQP